MSISINKNGIQTKGLCKEESIKVQSLDARFFLYPKSTIKRNGHNMRNKIDSMTFGLISNASIILKCRNFNVALVIPHPGQGT